jgi:hypothetical protein
MLDLVRNKSKGTLVGVIIGSCNNVDKVIHLHLVVLLFSTSLLVLRLHTYYSHVAVRSGLVAMVGDESIGGLGQARA